MSKRFFPFALSTQQSDHHQNVVRLFAPHAAGSLAPAPAAANDTPPIDQQLADAINSNNAIFTYVVAMQNTTLPPVKGEWYTAFQQSFHQAAVHASEWSTYSAALTGVPAGIANFATAFALNMNIINSYARTLESDPNNKEVLAALRVSILSLLSSIQSQKAAVADVVPKLTTFSGELVGDAQTMANAIKKALSEQGADQQKIAALQANIKTLQADIAKWNTVITAVGIGGGISVWLGCVLAIFSFGLGLAFAVAATVATITTIIVANQKIQDDYAEIRRKEGDIGTLNTEIAALASLQANLQHLIDLSNAAQGELKLIVEAWDQLENEVQAVVTDLQNASSATDPLNVQAVVADLNAANNDWQTLLQFCNVLKGINYTVIPGAQHLVAA